VPWDKDNGSDNWKNIVYAEHFSMGNYLFADGHVKSMHPLKTIEGNTNLWNINYNAPVTKRAREKLQAAQRTFE
jgi:prepilin-type processing-associated H-X9-DG protein